MAVIKIDPSVEATIRRGVVIPAHPLALTAQRKLDERRQRALSRYYIAAGAGGLAVAVHSTQFKIRDKSVGLFEPVLQLAKEEMQRAGESRNEPMVHIGGICGVTKQAVGEAELLSRLGYHAGLLSLSALRETDDNVLIAHCRAVADIIPVMGFYLQTAVGGRELSYGFWQRFVEIDNIVAIKIAPFNRYQTIDVIRAVAESGRDDITLYTGNDDNIVLDLVTPYQFMVNGRSVQRRITGGLLGHWAVWTRRAVKLLEDCHRVAEADDGIPARIVQSNLEVTDSNAAFFDAANNYGGCIAGLHEVLRRQGLLEGLWFLNPDETLGPGQMEEIDRVYQAYPDLNDDQFVAEHRDEWLSG